MKKSLNNIIYIIRELKWKLYFLKVELNCKTFNMGDVVYVNPKKINKRSELYKLSKQGEKFKIFDKDRFGYKIKTEEMIGYFMVDDNKILYDKPNKKQLREFSSYVDALIEK